MLNNVFIPGGMELTLSGLMLHIDIIMFITFYPCQFICGRNILLLFLPIM